MHSSPDPSGNMLSAEGLSHAGDINSGDGIAQRHKAPVHIAVHTAFVALPAVPLITINLNSPSLPAAGLQLAFSALAGLLVATGLRLARRIRRGVRRLS